LKIKSRKVFAILVIAMMLLALMPAGIVSAATTATGGGHTGFAAGTTATLSDLTLTSAAAGDINAAVDVVITLPASPADLVFDTTATLIYAGTGAARVTAFAPGHFTNNKTITIPVNTDFALGETLIVQGIKVSATTAGTYNLTATTAGGAPTGANIVVTAASYSAAASVLGVDKTSLATGGTATFTLTFKDGLGALLTSRTVADFYIKSNRDAETLGGLTPVGGTTLAAATGAQISGASTDANGQITFTIVSNVAGDVKISVYNGAANNAASLLVGEYTINYATGAVSTVGIASSSAAPSAGTEITLTAVVTDSAGNFLANQEVTFQRSFEGGAYANIGTATTNSIGRATYKVTETVAGAYSYRGKVGAVVSAAPVPVNYSAAAPFAIEAVTADGGVAKGVAATIKFNVKDVYGNLVKSSIGTPIAVTQKVPTDETVFNVAGAYNTNADGEVVLTGTPNKLGEYKITATIAGTGVSKTVTLTSAEFGTVKEVKVSLPTTKTSLRAQAAPADT